MSTEQPGVRELGCRITKNVRLLEELQYGPKRKGELADALGVTKQTIYNRFNDLEEYDLVERQGDDYGLTTVGRVVVERQLETLDAMREIFEARSMIQKLPADAFPPGDALEAARTVRPNGHPEQVRRAFCEWVLEADEVRGLLPHTSCEFVEHVGEKLRENGLSIGLVLSPETMAYFREYRAEDLRTVLESDSAVLVEAADLPPFGLVVVDEPRREAGLVCYTDDGYVRGFMRLPTECGYRWADEQLSEYLAELETLTVGQPVYKDRSS
jgi:predicted transcriptional regulator